MSWHGEENRSLLVYGTRVGLFSQQKVIPFILFWIWALLCSWGSSVYHPLHGTNCSGKVFGHPWLVCPQGCLFFQLSLAVQSVPTPLSHLCPRLFQLHISTTRYLTNWQATSPWTFEEILQEFCPNRAIPNGVLWMCKLLLVGITIKS